MAMEGASTLCTWPVTMGSIGPRDLKARRDPATCIPRPTVTVAAWLICAGSHRRFPWMRSRRHAVRVGRHRECGCSQRVVALDPTHHVPTAIIWLSSGESGIFEGIPPPARRSHPAATIHRQRCQWLVKRLGADIALLCPSHAPGCKRGSAVQQGLRLPHIARLPELIELTSRIFKRIKTTFVRR